MHSLPNRVTALGSKSYFLSFHAHTVSLTKVGGKGRDFKATLVQTLRESLDVYKHVFLLKFENLRSCRMRDVRMDWKESRIFLGKNSIAQVALGRTVEEEYKDNLHLISQVSCMANPLSS